MARHINLQLIMPSDGLDPVVTEKINSNSRMVQNYLNQDEQNITRTTIILEDEARGTYDYVFELVYPKGSLFHTTDKNYDPNKEMNGTWQLVSTTQDSFGSIYIWKRTK